MLHLFRWDPSAICVSPEGQRRGQRFMRGDWKCVMCKALYSFCAHYDLDHGDDCPGLVVPVPQDAMI
jgi:hypothetical protein